MFTCETVSFRGRRAVCLANGNLEVMVLPGGGHIASVRLRGSDVNPLWEPPWKTMEPADYEPEKHAFYGPSEGRLLASLAGHSLCLDHFGELSAAEVAAGGYFHGEAPNLTWKTLDRGTGHDSCWLTYGIELPEASINFRRTISLRSGHAVINFEEEVVNLLRRDVPLGYQQHVTVGPPFLEDGVTRVDIPAVKGRTFPRSLGPADRLKPDSDFTWPNAPGCKEDVRLDVFSPNPPSYSLCGVLQTPKDGEAFAVVSNTRLELMLGYVFSREVFPWTALWEENCGIVDSPYNGCTRAWGVEFGTVPLPTTRMENLNSGPLFGVPRFMVLPARSSVRTTYSAFLLACPDHWQGVEKIVRSNNELTIFELGPRQRRQTLKEA